MSNPGPCPSPLRSRWHEEMAERALPREDLRWSFSMSDEELAYQLQAGESGLNEDLPAEVQGSFGRYVDEMFATEPPSYRSSWAVPRPDESTRQGYMERRSLFEFDHPPDNSITESSFMGWYPEGSATLTYQDDNQELQSIHKINLDLIQARSPMLWLAFERDQLYLETLTSKTAFPFLRYLYSGTYALNGATGDFYEDVPTSVLLHCQLYRLGDIYDLPELKSQAYVNVLRQCEFGCSSPDKPIELCAAIQFTYKHLANHQNLVDAIINYCVSCFMSHRLAQDEEFKELAYELRPFHQDLCKNSMNREFANETASAIIQMPFKPYAPETYASREDIAPCKRLDDVIFHFHSSEDMETSSKKRRRLDTVQSARKDTVELPIRQREIELTDHIKEEAVIEDEDYKLGVKRRASEAAVPLAISGISQQLSGQPDVSDGEYELVEGPAAVEDASDSDSDASTFVEVKREDAESSSRDLPTRLSNQANAVDIGESDSDSDWTCV